MNTNPLSIVISQDIKVKKLLSRLLAMSVLNPTEFIELPMNELIFIFNTGKKISPVLTLLQKEGVIEIDSYAPYSAGFDKVYFNNKHSEVINEKLLSEKLKSYELTSSLKSIGIDSLIIKVNKKLIEDLLEDTQSNGDFHVFTFDDNGTLRLKKNKEFVSEHTFEKEGPRYKVLKYLSGKNNLGRQISAKDLAKCIGKGTKGDANGVISEIRSVINRKFGPTVKGKDFLPDINRGTGYMLGKNIRIN